jgi:hypothetical protein
MPPSSVHFNGSVNLPDAETVMREISSRIPTGVRRMTDGETGERNYWILFQIEKFTAMPELESVSTGKAYDTRQRGGTGDAPASPGRGDLSPGGEMARPRLRRCLGKVL